MGKVKFALGRGVHQTDLPAIPEEAATGAEAVRQVVVQELHRNRRDDCSEEDVWLSFEGALRAVSRHVVQDPLTEKQSEVDEITKRVLFAQSQLDACVEDLSMLMDTFDSNKNGKSNGAESEKGHRYAAISETFAAYMIERLERPGDEDLARDWEDVDAMLAQGVDEFAKACRFLVSQSSVNVSFRDLEFKVASSRARTHDETEGGGMPDRPTVGTALYSATIGACFGLLCAVLGCILHPFRAAYRYGTQSASANERDLVGGNPLQVLHKMSGVLESGRMTLVVGPPGSGKTTLLRALAGQLRTVDSRAAAAAESNIYYNKSSLRSLSGQQVSSTASYVQQQDSHLALMTVYETLKFAWETRRGHLASDASQNGWCGCNHSTGNSNTPAARYKALLIDKLGTAGAEKALGLERLTVDLTLSVLGLQPARDTLIGNASLKGVSGGEKRRVSLGETLVLGHDVLLCDSISDGLDSATTFEIIQYLCAAAHFLGKTGAAALLQPSPEVVDLFDDILVLAEGRIMYLGPREEALDYFASIGLPCPDTKDIGDFLAEVPVSLDLYATTADAPRTVEALAQKWESSDHFGRGVSKKLQRLDQATTPYAVTTPLETTRDDQEMVLLNERSLLREFRQCFLREKALFLRNSGAIKARIFQNIFSGSIYGTLFYQIADDQWYLKAMLFGSVPGFMLAGFLGRVAGYVSERPTYYKHLNARLYRALPLVLARYVMRLPLKLLDAIVFGNMVYFLCGLALRIEQYVAFMLLIVIFAQCVETMIEVISFSFADSNTGTVVGVFVYLIMIVLSGQVATPNVIPVPLRPVFYVNPVSYIYQALAVNEFKSSVKNYDRNPCPSPGDIKIPVRCGDVYLQNRQITTDAAYIWIAFAVLISYTVLFLVLSATALTFIHHKPAEAQKQVSTLASASGQQKATVCPDSDRYTQEQGNGLSTRLLQRRQSSVAIDAQTLTFHNIYYTIDLARGESIDLLQGISGWARPGRLTALMGNSGAGKSTLLDCLCNRKTVGSMRGQVLFNGSSLSKAAVSRTIAYVEQFGVHTEMSTVEEAVVFSARLRLDTSSLSSAACADGQDRAIYNYAREILETLELTNTASAMCGELSVEQNKRLTVAVELAANPSVLFADEPTTGLEARAAQRVMRCLKIVAGTRTVVATIHQPSTSVFALFDDLILLKRGGRVVFQGELGANSKHMVEYFEQIPGIPRLKANYNPATWMLEVVMGVGDSGTLSDDSVSTSDDGTTENLSRGIDFESLYHTSALRKRNMRYLKSLLPKSRARLAHFESLASNGEEDAGDSVGVNIRRRRVLPQNRAGSTSRLASFRSSNESLQSIRLQSGGWDVLGGGFTGGSPSPSLSVRARSDIAPILAAGPGVKAEALALGSKASLFKQGYLLLQRNLRSYWRSPNFTLGRTVTLTLVTILVTLCFYQQKYTDVAGVQSRVAAINIIVMLGGNHNLFNIQSFVQAKKVVFYRERASGMYSATAAVLSDGFVELPYLVGQAVLAVNIMYWGVGLQKDTADYFLYFVTFLTYLVLMTWAGMFIALASKDTLSGLVMGNIFVTIFYLTAGITVPFTSLPDAFKPLYWISPIRMTLENMVVSQFHADASIMCDPQGVPVHSPHSNSSDMMCTKDGQPESMVTGRITTAQEYVLKEFLTGYTADNEYYNLMFMFLWIIMLRVAASIVTIYVNHSKR